MLVGGLSEKKGASTSKTTRTTKRKTPSYF
jgi:hypothetical protein